MLTSGATAELVPSNGNYRFYVVSTIPGFEPLADEDIAALAVFVRMARMSWGQDFTPAAVKLACPETPCSDRIRDFFRCPVTYDQGAFELVMRAADLERPLPTANGELLAATDKVIAGYMAKLVRADVTTRARAEIMEALPSGRISDESIADTLHMSSRTFQRRLKEEGTTFKRLLEEVRRELALQYIEDPTISITELSYLLGFSEPSSFARVFKNWTGQSPSAARNAS
jgi:AraC-like DNA-binding protein